MSNVLTTVQVNYRVQRARSAIGALNSAIAQWLGDRSVPEVVIGAVQVVMDELIGNLQHHDPENLDPLEVELRLDDDALDVKLSYRSKDFDVRRNREVDTLTPISERRIGGLGLHLIQSLMDDVQYEFLHGLISLRMRKYIPPSMA